MIKNENIIIITIDVMSTFIYTEIRSRLVLFRYLFHLFLCTLSNIFWTMCQVLYSSLVGGLKN